MYFECEESVHLLYRVQSSDVCTGEGEIVIMISFQNILVGSLQPKLHCHNNKKQFLFALISGNRAGWICLVMITLY